MQLTYHLDQRIGFHLGLFAFSLLLALLAPLKASAAEIDFTRHLSHHYSEVGNLVAKRDTFFGVPGSARMIVTSSSEEVSASIRLNGIEVAGFDSTSGTGQFEIPVTLAEDNTISVTLNGVPGGSVSVRIRQVADVELHVEARLHFNTNVSNFTAALEFYGKLGFDTVMGFPDTNTLEMAQAMGIKTPTSYDGSKGGSAGGYLLHGELVALSGFKGGVMDLIEYIIPRNEEPPYALINHLGMARAAMLTTNIEADYKYMKNIGVEFISAPTARSDGTLFAIFTDSDGTHYELIEIAGEDDETETTHIVSLAQVNINVSDFERSSAWYQMMGYQVSQKLASTDSLEVANAMGFDEKFEINGAIVTHQTDGSMLELVQWISPHNPERAYSIPLNHLGINRMAFATSDLAADVVTLRSQGVEFISDITPCCSGPESSGKLVAFYDPDGAVIELVEQDFLSTILAVLSWLFDRIF